MGTDDFQEAESTWRQALQRRVADAQGARTDEQMAELLGVSRTRYNKWKTRPGSQIPTRLIPKFCAICGVDLIEFITGQAKPVRAHPPARKRRSAA